MAAHQEVYNFVNKSMSLLKNTSLAAQGALAHRLQRRPRPNHNNAKSGARPCLPPLGFNMAGGWGSKTKTKKIHKSLEMS